MLSFRKKQTCAFTIVELLVVIAIIGVLLALLLPALGGVRRKSRKTAEENDLKQVGHAWLLYANYSDDAALPGYLEIPVQAPRMPNVSRGWGVRYNYFNHDPVPPAPNYASGDLNAAGPWTWRLMKYFDYSYEIVHGYDTSDDPDLKMLTNDSALALRVAETPAFGYNGYYIGGYWRMQQDPGGGPMVPLYDFYNHCSLVNGVANGPRVTVPITVGQISRSSQIVVFCSSTLVKEPPGLQSKFLDDRPGSYLIVPPDLGATPQWRVSQAGGLDHVETLTTNGGAGVFVPIGRHTGAAAVLYADGHIEQQSFNALTDPRMWIDSATSLDYRHDVCVP